MAALLFNDLILPSVDAVSTALEAERGSPTAGPWLATKQNQFRRVKANQLAQV
jgi:hypothetical protein